MEQTGLLLLSTVLPTTPGFMPSCQAPLLSQLSFQGSLSTP